MQLGLHVVAQPVVGRFRLHMENKVYSKKRLMLAILFLLPIWLVVFNHAYGQDPNSQVLLDGFLDQVEHLEGSSSALIIKATGSGVKKGGLTTRIRWQGDYGLESKIDSSAERRWIWNPAYAALIEKTADSGDWMLRKIMPSTDPAYSTMISGNSVGKSSLGSPVYNRLKYIEPATSESPNSDSFWKFRYKPDVVDQFCANASQNSILIRFEGSTSSNSRISELKYIEPANKMEIENTVNFKFSNDSLLPFEITYKGVLRNGSTEEMIRKTKVSVDNESSFAQSESYLNNYGLPEPKFAQAGQSWVWMSIFAVLIFVLFGVFLWKRAA